MADDLKLASDQVNKFIHDTETARSLSERDRDYYDHKQWTDAQIAVLARRSQAPIVVNRIRPKIQGLLGLLSLRNTDPKAYPRTQKHEDAAHAMTDALRYVADNNDFNNNVKPAVAEDFFVEGYGAAIVDVKQTKAGMDIRVQRIPWDRFYYDPHSRRKDFRDATYMGYYLWLYKHQAKEMFPNADFDGLFQQQKGNETFDDRPKWVDTKRDRVRIATHYYLKSGVWHRIIFTEEMALRESEVSPFLDDDGEPVNPIEAVSAYVDRENNRSGEVRGMVPQQDEINHRRSKFLHMLSTRQTFSRRGAASDVSRLKRELAKPDGHIEFEGEAFGRDFGVLPNGDMAEGQFLLLNEAKSELDATSFNAQLAGERQNGTLSGRAIDKLQQAGTIELNGLFTQLNNWEKRIYRQIWGRVRQFWDEEKWIRITDDHDNLRWVGLNTTITLQQKLEEIINDESLPRLMRTGAARVFTAFIQTDDPRLEAPIEIRNPVAMLDVDIILDQSFDSVNIQQEQFEMLAQFAQGAPDIDIIDLIELSQWRGKEELIEKIEQRRADRAQQFGNVAQLQAISQQAKAAEDQASAKLKEQQAIEQQLKNMKLLNGTEDLSKVQETIARASKTEQEALQKALENQSLARNPDENPQVFV